MESFFLIKDFLFDNKLKYGGVKLFQLKTKIIFVHNSVVLEASLFMVCF